MLVRPVSGQLRSAGTEAAQEDNHAGAANSTILNHLRIALCQSGKAAEGIVALQKAVTLSPASARRVGASIVTASGMPDTVAESVADCVERPVPSPRQIATPSRRNSGLKKTSYSARSFPSLPLPAIWKQRISA